MLDGQKWKIMVVDDEKMNLSLIGHILADDYELSFAQNGEKALEIVTKVKPHIILLDVTMPGLDGFEVCKRLKANPETKRIPVIFITGVADIVNEKHGFEVGGVDYITKPITPSIVLARLENHIRIFKQKEICEIEILKRTADLEESQKSVIYMLGEVGHYNDNDMGDHIWRMAHYSNMIAKKIGWNDDDSELLKMAAPLHDLGKIGISDSILKKPDKLNIEEWKTMQEHTSIGHRILSKSNTPLFNMAADIALCHHERWNGKGYPKGLKGQDIPLAARIVSIADVFDILTMERPFKKAWPIADSLKEIKKNSAVFFDPDLVDAFLSLETELRDYLKK